MSNDIEGTYPSREPAPSVTAPNDDVDLTIDEVQTTVEVTTEVAPPPRDSGRRPPAASPRGERQLVSETRTPRPTDDYLAPSASLVEIVDEYEAAFAARSGLATPASIRMDRALLAFMRKVSEEA